MIRRYLILFILITQYSYAASESDSSGHAHRGGKGKKKQTNTSTSSGASGTIWFNCFIKSSPAIPIEGPCVNLVMVLKDSDGNSLLKTRTNAQGRFDFSAESGKDYEVEVGSKLYEIISEKRSVHVGDRVGLVLQQKQSLHLFMVGRPSGFYVCLFNLSFV